MLINRTRISSLFLSIVLVILAHQLALLPTSASESCANFTDEGTTSGVTKFNTVKAQMWFNDGTWWGAFSDNDTGIHFYTFLGSAATQGPIIDDDTAGIPDVLWDGTNLFVLIWKSASLSTLYKYSYDSAAKTYNLVDNFPIDLPLIGGSNSAIVLDEDSTGKLWATYTGTQGSSADGMVHVIWSTSADHLVWDTDGITFDSGLTPKSEISAITHFDGNKIGVAWSNQPAQQIAFSYHIDGDAETNWSAKEIVDSGLGPRGLGPVADDHLSIKAAPDGRIFLVAKDNDNDGTGQHAKEGRLWLYIRSAAGAWGQKTIVQPDVSQLPTRPVLLLDVTNNQAYVIYHDETPSGNGRNFITHASMDNPSFGSPCVLTMTPSSNPTSTKQNLDSSTGLMAATSTGSTDTNQIVFRGLAINPPNPVPSTTSLSPVSAIAGGASFTLTVDGSNFVNTSVVRFNGSDRATSYVGANQLTAQITAADLQAAGVFAVTVLNPAPGGGTSNALSFTVNNPAPTLTGLSQSSATAGDAAFTLTINGSGFVSGSVVRFNGSDRATSFVSANQLTAQITAADLQAAGVFAVTVVNPAPGQGSSSALNFTVNNPAPVASGLSQSSATLGDAAFTLTINGSGFVSGSVVKFNGSDRLTSFVSGNQLTAQIPAADLQVAGVFAVTVVNPAPGGGSSSALNFTVNNPAPVASSLSQSSATLDDAAFTLAVNGSNFVDGSVVRFNGHDRLTNSVTGNQLAAQLTAADLQVAGVFAVTVVNPAPGGGSSSGLNFTVNNPAPVASGLSQSSATTGDAAFTLTINGNSFVNAAVVRFNGSDRATSFVSGNQLTAQLTAADLQVAGVFAVTVVNPAPGGGSSSGLNFTVNNPAPVASGLSQSSATAGDAAFILTINGSGFVGGSVVRFNGSNRATSFVSGNQLTAQLTAADLQAAGAFAVTVVNPAPGGGTSSALNFMVDNPAPVASGLSQSSATAGDSSFTLTINGSGFVNGAVVTFNGSVRATSFVSGNQLTAQITAADLQAAGVFALTVVNPAPGGGSSSGLNFTVNNPAPTLSSLSQSSATRGDAAFTLTINGSGFVSSSVMRFNGSNRAINFVSGNQLTAQLTAADLQAAGVFAVTVINPAPGGGSSSGLNFTVNNPAPTLSGLSQSSATIDDAVFTLTINGGGFVSGSVVRFNGSDRPTSFVSGNQMAAQLTAADLQVAGVFAVTVVNPTPGGGSSNGLNFTVNNPAPTLSGLPQSSATAGGAAFTLTVQGSGFVNGSVVRWNNLDRPTAIVNKTQLTAQVTAEDIQSAGTASVTVFNPAPGGGQSNAINFTINNLLPTVQFSAANYSMTEDNDSVNITVVRTGDTSTAGTVDYATNDSFVFVPCVTRSGASLQRCDYALAAGTLSFAPGESTKSFTLLITNDAYVEGPETVTLTLRNPKGATLGASSTATVTILDNDTVLPTSNPIDDARFFVKQHYIDLLNRLPDQSGLDYWSNEITKCGSDAKCVQNRRIGVSAAFFIEQEFQDTGFVVHRLYRAAYGQRPTYPQFMPDRSQLVSGPQLQATTLEFATRFVNRAEFKQAYPESLTPAQFVNKLYDTAGLTPYSTERVQAINAMMASGKTRVQSLLDLIEIQEFKSREFKPAFVLMQYFGYLRRDPDEGGYDFWLNVLNSREPDNYRGMVCAFITSREYQERFSSVATRSNQDCAP